MTDTQTQEKEKARPTAREGRGSRDNKGGDDRRSRGRRRGAPQRERSEFDQKIIDIRRVTRVVAGGRRFSFSVSVVIGDHKGRVGVGIGKSGDTSLAISKAVRDAQKGMIRVPRTKEQSIPSAVSAKFKASYVEIWPAPARGLVAGSSVRDVLEMAGISDVNAKLLSRSKNKLNNARATIAALKKLRVKSARA